VVNIHLEPLNSYRNERPVAWLVRVWKEGDPEENFKARRPYEFSFVAHEVLPLVVEFKGLSEMPVLSAVRASFRTFAAMGFELARIEHNGRVQNFDLLRFKA
jgi:hypothetical protein